jgi:predicted DNA-binding transcriptional regulator AlpA
LAKWDVAKSDVAEPNGQPPLWSVEEVSAFLGVPVKTLYEWRRKGYGPRGTRVGRYVRYKPDGVVAWFDNLERHEAAA